MPVNKVADGVHTIQLDHVRVFVLENHPEGEVTIVDAGFPDDGEKLVQTLKDEFGGVDRIIITHGDEGHFGGVPALTEAFDPVVAVPGGAKGYHDALDEGVDIHFADGDRLEGGIRIIQVPGHTVANSALLLEDQSILIAGDVLEGSDRRGLPAGYLVPPAAQFNDYSHAAAERNLGKLFEYDIETVLVSHGSHVEDDPLERLDNWLLDRQWSLEY